ncbi:hypothetical protein D3C87_1136750 [compost metagenome]|jgi:hypothetical protein|uniref:Tli3-like domain-containing protein n=1 Tax=Cupriavidus campinensis TaxID=151783 RepID=A0AAE9L266_9BURK|nr:MULTISPECIES: hypothetical protein [Cupriavidus]URF04361.1 hypothetical protein M5D45_00385 [Cupriavidus campinensis]CAG2155571.1 hypothetical protein LMG19282_04970 [Cupriavidus campinensis]
MRSAITAAALGALLIAGCATPPSYVGPPLDAVYDVPPQVIYRIDDHRFVTLENYWDCHHGTTYYNDTKQGIRKRLGRNGIENFQGRLINADATGLNLVIPSSQPPERTCSDRGCSISLLYSTDGGKTFKGWRYMVSFDPFKDSKRFTIAATEDAMYISKLHSETTGRIITARYPLIPGFVYGKEDLPNGLRIEFDTKLPSGLRSPTGQERFSCDPSIRPTNPPVVR